MWALQFCRCRHQIHVPKRIYLWHLACSLHQKTETNVFTGRMPAVQGIDNSRLSTSHNEINGCKNWTLRNFPWHRTTAGESQSQSPKKAEEKSLLFTAIVRVNKHKSRNKKLKTNISSRPLVLHSKVHERLHMYNHKTALIPRSKQQRRPKCSTNLVASKNQEGWWYGMMDERQLW